MSDCQVNVFYSEEDGGYFADISDLEACSAFGRVCRGKRLPRSRRRRRPGSPLLATPGSQSRSLATGRPSTHGRSTHSTSAKRQPVLG